MTVSISSCPDGANMKLVRVTKYGREFEHEYASIARESSRVFNTIKDILADQEAYNNQQLLWATQSLRDSPFLFDPFPGYQHMITDIFNESFSELASLYDSIESSANFLASNYVPVNVIQAWWKKSRSNARKAVQRFEPFCASHPDMSLDEKAHAWIKCFNDCFKDQLA
jgi:hypothetical protein